jgi:uncharacterized protein
MRRNTELYKPSLYNVIIPLKGGSALAYNGVSGALAVWTEMDRAIYDFIAVGAKTDEALAAAGTDKHLDLILDDLEKGMFVVGAGLDEHKRVERTVNLVRYDGRAASFTIAPTLACNFGCDYCYQSDSARLGAMTGDARRRVVEFVRKRSLGKRALGVTWYGGEPLLETDLVCSISDELAADCAGRGVSYSSSIVTNGYFLTSETARRLLGAKVTYAQVTMDGDRPTHDSRRVLKGGGPTFDRILKNVAESANVEGFTITIRVNVDRRNMSAVAGLLDSLSGAGLSRRENFRVYFAPVDVCSQECLRVIGEVMSLDEYAKAEANLFEMAMDKGLAVASLPFRLFSLCAAVKPNGFVVLPNGDVHKCWNTVSYPSERLCGIDEAGSIEDTPLYKDWSYGPLFAAPECRDCVILPNCTGGCAYKSKGAELSTSCVSLKRNIRERLVQYAVSRKAIEMDDVLERSDATHR